MNEWISVDTALPDDCNEVVVAVQDRTSKSNLVSMIAYYRAVADEWYADGEDGRWSLLNYGLIPKYWRILELPEPPHATLPDALRSHQGEGE
jgi:hypothetical protein